MEDDEITLPFLRVTLLGAAGSGKTSLIESFVNNAVAPGIPATTEPTISYTNVRLGVGDDDAKPTSGQSDINVLVEIEDTFGSDGVGYVDHHPRTISHFYDLWWPSLSTYTTNATAHLHTDKKQTKRSALRGKKRDEQEAAPLSMFSAPLDGKFRPLTRNRMAFLICFDSTDTSSFKEALKVHAEQQAQFGKLVDAGVSQRMKPIVYLVATKIDKDPWSEEFRRVLDSASRYTIESEENSVNALMEVSALQYRGVSKLFRSVLQDVRANSALWQVMSNKDRNKEDGIAGSLGKAGADCVVQ